MLFANHVYGYSESARECIVDIHIANVAIDKVDTNINVSINNKIVYDSNVKYSKPNQYNNNVQVKMECGANYLRVRGNNNRVSLTKTVNISRDHYNIYIIFHKRSGDGFFTHYVENHKKIIDAQLSKLGSCEQGCNVIVGVGNMSQYFDPIDITIAIDGIVAASEYYYYCGRDGFEGHNYKGHSFKIKRGKHVLTIKANQEKIHKTHHFTVATGQLYIKIKYAYYASGNSTNDLIVSVQNMPIMIR